MYVLKQSHNCSVPFFTLAQKQVSHDAAHIESYKKHLADLKWKYHYHSNSII